MPTRCCVPGCSEGGGHRFPNNHDLCMKWRVAIKRSDGKAGLWKPGKHDVVCHQHFTLDDYKQTLSGRILHSKNTCDRSRLKVDAVPSVFSFRPDTTIISPRALRLQSRKQQVTVDDSEILSQGIQNEVEVQVESKQESDTIIIESESDITVDVDVQCELLGRYSIENFIDNQKAVLFYTGFKTYEHFMFLFHSLGPAAYELKYKCSVLQPADQLFLTVIKLRCAKEDLELGMFKKNDAQNEIFCQFSTYCKQFFFCYFRLYVH